MLLNGATLSYSQTDSGTYTALPGLKEVPDLGNEKEKIENTGLSDINKQYEYGIGDYGELEYKFKYDNSSSTTAYRLMRNYSENNTTVYFKETLSDGTIFKFSAQCSVKINGGGVNTVAEWTLKLAVKSDITVTDPTEA